MRTDSMPENCPQCGAPTVEGLDCWEQLGAILAWEWQDPELLGVHFLTVASYNLQHPAQFGKKAIEELKASFTAYLQGRVSVPEIRRAASARYNGKAKVLCDAALCRPAPRRWPTTIADVYLPGKPERASHRVKQWAARIAEEIA
jgi:Family of unknown function (DUF5946)